MSKIDPPAGWPDIDGIDTFERLLGGPVPGSPMNRSIGNLTSRTKWLRENMVDRNELSSASGSGSVGYQPNVSGALVQNLQAVLRQFSVSVKAFGAVGDGSADDTAALQAAISSGAPLDWGDSRNTFRITQTLTSSGPLAWLSNGAKVVADMAAPVQRAVFVDALTGKNNYIGNLQIDGQNKVFTGLRVIAAADAAACLVIDRPVIRNVKRSSTAFTEGCGIFVTGDFDVCHILEPYIQNVTMSAGAGISGVAGVNGIAVRAGSGRPRLINITEPFIDNVSSDDLNYTNDQDGILVWTDRSTSTIIRPTTTHVWGGYFRNCLGRSIKCQTERAYIAGADIYRDRGFTGATLLPDIDLQVGGGRVTGVTAHYDGVSNKPQGLILVNTPDELTKDVPVGMVDGVQVTLTNGAVLQQVVMCASRGRLKNVYRASNLSVSGSGLSYFVRLVGGVDTGTFDLALNGADGPVGTAAVWASSSSGLSVSGHVTMRDVINTSGTDVPAMTCQFATFRPLLSVSGSYGLLASKTATMSNSNGVVMRVPALAPEGAANSGVFRPVSFSLADGETFKFPQSFVNVNSGMIIVSVGASRVDQGLFACDSTQVTTLAGGTGITVGTTTEPATGSYRMWSDATGPYISNRSGAARTFTCFMIG